MKKIAVRRDALKEMWFHVTFRCNLSCAHCLFRCCADYDRFTDMTLDEAKRYAAEAAESGARALYITGGEPLVWTPLPEFLMFLNTLPGIAGVTLLTNGTRINSEWAETFRRCRNLTIRVSLECFTEQTNDSYRGAGAFEKALTGMRALNQSEITPWVCYTNKSGGHVRPEDTKSLEKDFQRVLGQEHGVHISGLKVLGLYRKGRMTPEGEGAPMQLPTDFERRLAEVQCAFGAAVSPLGIVPCPILADAPEAKLAGDIRNLPHSSLEISHPCCADCFRTGSTCGQKE